jgi:hypothetical protein
MNVRESQMGSAVPQSEFATQLTQRFDRRRQRGAAAGQSMFCAHSTHVPVAVLQTPRPVQSVFFAHSTQAPEVVSQTGAPGSWHCVSAVHFVPAWHVWSRGEQMGAATPQSVSVRHVSHRPVTQNGAAFGQSMSAPHSTQPSVVSQMGRGAEHWFVPLIPQIAFPSPGPGPPASRAVPSGDVPPS